MTDNLLSNHVQPAQQSILPPFSGTLRKDDKLKLSKENFKESIDNVFRNKDINPIGQLNTTPNFPTPYVLAQFSSKAYKDYKRRETDADYEKRLTLPDGWKLLTTASNARMNNGYFGAAYWHPEYQQVVIAHRGTKPKTLGAVWTDIKGVLFKHYVKQIYSATTFAYKIVEVLQEVNREKGVHFQVFFTGHSLGGWLAQITTYTTEYLKIGEDKNFLKIDNTLQNYHPHTVVFDSPGCRAMLSEIIDAFDLRQNSGDSVLQHLDITSYLSAPNRVNTCNSHVGTIYRIFIDSSDMGWCAKYTALYNTATHSMNKILKVFDPETGQVYKDENDRLKIREVIDWPVSGRLLRRGEYKRFFDWAQHFNNYHPEITDQEYMRSRGSHPIRYQTKVYEGQINNLRIFNQEEKEFLQGFRRLSMLPEFFKPKEVFSVMKNDQAEKEAEKKLQSFQIGEGNIRCADASTLQALIPYVKRLLQLFPKIKENVNYASSPHEVRNRVYQFETKTYLEEIEKSPLDFNSDTLGLEGFLESDEQQVLHLRMVDGDAWTGLIKVYRIFEKTSGSTRLLRESKHTILTLDRFLTVNKMIDFNTFMTSTETPYLLMISWESNHLCVDETQQIFQKLFNTIKGKPFIKFILVTQLESTSDFIQQMATTTLTNMFVSRDEKLTWTDLTTESQKKVLEKTVVFQGSKITLNQLISIDSPVASLLPISNLLGEHPINIPKEPISNTTSNGYSDEWYIGRTFNHQVAIKKDILNDVTKRNFPDFLANTEQEFKRLCQQNSDSNVHLVVKDKSRKLVWQASQGSLEALRKYIDTQTPHTYTPMDLDKLLEQVQHQRVMLISDTAGMGKSTVLTHLSEQIKQKSPNSWVLRIDLNNHTDELKILKNGKIDKEKATEFVSKNLLKFDNKLDLKLFEHCSKQKQNIRIVLMLDGFDEISPHYGKNVIDLLQTLKENSVLEFWITTRPHLRQELEDNLQQLSYTLEPFSRENQVEFLVKFWLLKDWFTKLGNGEKGKAKNKLEIYAKKLIKKLTKSISERDKEFTGIPLQCHMLAEAFDDKVKKFCQSSDSMPDLPFELDLLQLYDLFIKRKYDIFLGEKYRIVLSNVNAIEEREEFVKKAENFHQKLALQLLFPGIQATLQIYDNSTFSDEEVTKMSRIGIVQMNYEDKIHFIHRTFAEYHVAKFVVNQMTKEQNPSTQVQQFLLKEVLLKEECLVIRVFIDGLLSKSKPSIILKQYGNRIVELCKKDGTLIQDEETTILHRAAYEGNAHIIGFLLDSLKEGKSTETLNEFLLAKNSDGRTAWHLAAKGGNTDVWHNLWNWAQQTLTPQEMNNKLLLAKDDYEETVWHRAAKGGNMQLLEKIWEWAKETLTREELNNRLLLNKEKVGRTAWHVAAGFGYTQVLEKLWEWSKEKLTTEELNNELLLAKDSKGQTAWHYAAQTGNKETLEKIWGWANEEKQNLKNNLLLVADDYGYNAWFLATEWGREEVCEKIWMWAERELTSEELKNKFLLAQCGMDPTSWHLAAKRGNTNQLCKLWEWCKQVLTREELNNTLLLGQNGWGRTALHMAAEAGHTEVIVKVCEWAKEAKLNIRDNLLLALDNYGYTAWHLAALGDNTEAWEKLWYLVKEELTTEEINNKLLLAKNIQQRTAFHLAAEDGKTDVLEKLWVWAKEKLTTEELHNKLLLAKDLEEQTAWHRAAETGQTNVLQKLCDWVKEAKLHLENNPLLTQDKDGKTALHLAARAGRAEVWEWAKKELKPEELKNTFLMPKSRMQVTSHHMTADIENTDELDKLWKWAQEKLKREKITRSMLYKGFQGHNVWHNAVIYDNTRILEKTWEWFKEELTKEELYEKLFVDKDNEEKTIMHMAAQGGNIEIIEKVWRWVTEVIPNVRNKLLLDQDMDGHTPWHLAAKSGKAEVWEKLWYWAKECLTREELNNTLLLAKNSMHRTVWHLVAEDGNADALQKLWAWAKDTITQEELNNKLLLAKDLQGQTAWHRAAEGCHIKVLEKLCEWAKEEKLNIKDNLLLVQDKEGKSAFDILKQNIRLKESYDLANCGILEKYLSADDA